MNFRLILISFFLLISFHINAQEDYKLEVKDETGNIEMIPYSAVEQPPLAQGCKEKWKYEKRKKCTADYVASHFNRKFNTELAEEIDFKGIMKMTIKFVINTEGKVIDINVNGASEIMNEHAKEVISKLPNFTPGINNGRLVNVGYVFPVAFQVL